MFILSVKTKLATLVILPWLILLSLIGMFGLQLQKNILFQSFSTQWRYGVNFLLKITPLLISLATFLLLLTKRSHRFFPWYFTWVVVWLPFLAHFSSQPTLGVKLIGQPRWKYILSQFYFYWFAFLLSLSFSALLRYLPWLYYGSYSDEIITKQTLFIWIPGLLMFIAISLLNLKNNFVNKQLID
jgi:hypothetical protein